MMKTTITAALAAAAALAAGGLLSGMRERLAVARSTGSVRSRPARHEASAGTLPRRPNGLSSRDQGRQSRAVPMAVPHYYEVPQNGLQSARKQAGANGAQSV